MANLTKEYFDQQLEKLATKDDIDELARLVNGGLTNQQEYMEKRFDELERKLDVRAEVDQLKNQMKRVWDALDLG